MSWFWLIFIATNLFAVSDLIDKFVVSKKFKNAFAFALTNFLFSTLFVLFLVPLVDFSGGSGWPLWLGFSTGLIYFLMWIFLWLAMIRAEISRVMAVFNLVPVFNAFLAMIFLSEQIAGWKWLAMLLIIVGATICSWESKAKNRLSKAYLLALLAAFFSAVGNVSSKVASNYISALALYPISQLGGLPFNLLLLRKKGVWQETRTNLRNWQIVRVLLLRNLFNFIAVVFFYLAIGQGPISLIMAVYGITPFLIFLYATLVSRFRPDLIKEELTRQALFAKALAIIFIVSGVILINQ